MTGKSLRQVEHVRGHIWDTDIPERLLFEIKVDWNDGMFLWVFLFTKFMNVGCVDRMFQ